MSSLSETIPWGTRTFVMGILNMTPDSFSGDGLLQRSLDPLEILVAQAKEFVDAGADILDVGGESTRPGASKLSEQEELTRVLPAIKALRCAGLTTLISVDTYKASVAEAALEAGANWINDVRGLRADPKMASVAVRYAARVVLMHNRSQSSDVEMQTHFGEHCYFGMRNSDLIENVNRELMSCVMQARMAGIKDENIILDPGIGFGKSVFQNLELIRRLDEIRRLGFPVILGPSRKSFIGCTLDLPPHDRLEGTASAVAIGISRGVDIIRVHDVKSMVRVARMTDALIRPL
jgi:dihydropteroate synthase